MFASTKALEFTRAFQISARREKFQIPYARILYDGTTYPWYHLIYAYGALCMNKQESSRSFEVTEFGKCYNFFKKTCLLFRNRAGELVVARNYTSRPPIAAGKSRKDGFRRGLAVGETSKHLISSGLGAES
ncbi:hypothetical protein D5086_004578 [Populus alba]|uniref:Uncharacterized protein n=1 Tax=Populus alba TaxID=43335 RepID=A0ACC4CSZ3_POPAL